MNDRLFFGLIFISIAAFIISASVFWGAYIPVNDELKRVENAGPQLCTLNHITCVENDNSYSSCCDWFRFRVAWTFTYKDKFYRENIPEISGCDIPISNCDCINLQTHLWNSLPNTSYFWVDPENVDDGLLLDLIDLRASAATTGASFIFSTLFFAVGIISLMWSLIIFKEWSYDDMYNFILGVPAIIVNHARKYFVYSNDSS